MFKVAALVWIMLATTLAGIALMVVLVVPQFAEQAAVLLPAACGAATVLAAPLSYLIARRIAGGTLKSV
ncbi:MAG: hypothetical protein ACRCS9_14910 [Hyphomicrobium sp.]